MRIRSIFILLALYAVGTGPALPQDNVFKGILGGILKGALSGGSPEQNNRNQQPQYQGNSTRSAQAILPPADRHTLNDEMVHYLIADFVANTNSRSTTGAPCGNFFEIPEVRVVDRRIRSDTASLQIQLTARPKTNVEPFFILMCFGINTQRPWRAGGTNVMQGVYDFELWDDGWRVTPRRPR
jgi:hypothetical protein